MFASVDQNPLDMVLLCIQSLKIFLSSIYKYFMINNSFYVIFNCNNATKLHKKKLSNLILGWGKQQLIKQHENQVFNIKNVMFLFTKNLLIDYKLQYKLAIINQM
jgi:hypothetical protein